MGDEMTGFAKAVIVGNLGQDPDMRYTANGDPVANMTVAYTRRGQDETEWIRVAAFGKLAETCEHWLKKGDRVYFEGWLKLNEWTSKEGKERAQIQVDAVFLEMLGKPKHESQPPAASGAAGDGFDEIPF